MEKNLFIFCSLEATMIKLKETIKIFKRKPMQIVFVFCIVFFWNNVVYAQNTIRRHFIIAYDISTSYNSYAINSILESLFSNNRIEVSGDQHILNQERLNGKLFFDSMKDEVSFFDFNLSNSDIASLNGEHSETKLTQEIPDLYFKAQANWASYKERVPDIVSYIIARLNHPRSTSNFTIPNLVYPLILNSIDQPKYAEEYILIILTQNTPETIKIDDLNRLKGRINNPVFNSEAYKKQIDLLTSKFNKNDYFNFNGIFGYFITPKNIKPASATNTVSINSDIEFTQIGYNSNEFKTSPIKVKFPDNESLNPFEITLTINGQNKEGNSEIFNGMIASKINENDWSSDYLNNNAWNEPFNKQIKFDKASSTYAIPSLKFDLGVLKTETNFDSLKLNFEIKSKAKTLVNNSLNYIFYAETLIPNRNVIYTEYTEYLMYHTIIPIATIIIVLLVLIILLRKAISRGKIQDVKLIIEGINDNFMSVENQTVSKYDCWFWQGEKQKSIWIRGSLVYNESGFKLKGNSKLECWIEDLKMNDNFEFCVNDDLKNNGCNKWISVPIKNNEFEFNTDVIIRSGNPDFKKLNMLKFKVKIRITTNVFGIFNSENCKEDYYEFGIREDIGNLWVGLDPGTCGSCISVGHGGPINNPKIYNVTTEILSGEKVSIEDIIPSKLILNDPSIVEMDPYQMIPGEDYIYGFSAHSQWIANVKDGNCYQSIKKLLGYKSTGQDLIIAQFPNNRTKLFKGVQLAYLLIKGLYVNLKIFVEKMDFNDRNELVSPNVDKPFNPLRAVVAIPNNFTLPKIQDMVDSIKMTGQFKEIRYVYEAEGILFSYMKKKLPEERETVMVFDMGGATINASIFEIKPERKDESNIYKIQTLGRIGYTGGGDNIDVALMETIFSIPVVKKAFSTQKGLGAEVDLKKYKLDNKSMILDLMYQLKLDIIKLKNEPQNYNGFLLDVNSFNMMLRTKFGLKVEESDWTENDLKFLTKEKKNVINLLTSKPFADFVFENVKDAVAELASSPGINKLTKIDKLIFSGRSTLFPKIKEGVYETLKMKNIEYTEWTGFSADEIKTAVAYGACWYGMYSNIVHLDHTRVTSCYGIRHTINGLKGGFVELIPMNSKFNYDGVAENSLPLESNFHDDGNMIEFYQIMGANAEDILINNILHKMNFLGRIRAKEKTKSIKMSLDIKDNIKYEVIFGTGHPEDEKSSQLNGIYTRDITKENNWAYVFSVSDAEIRSRFDNKEKKQVSRTTFSDNTNENPGIF